VFRVDAKPLNQDQFVVLFARHERRLRSFIASLLTCRSDLVDDVLQSTSLVAWQKLDTFSYVGETPDEELIRWMCTMARFEVLNASRKVSSKLLSLDATMIDAIADCYIDQMDVLEDRFQALKGCLERLPAHQYEMLRLRYWQGLSVDEVALRVGRQLNAVYTALSRVRKTLEQCITHKLRQEGHVL
jgi:RNA polymerase sigma-70 factor (ECF subfamily)